MFILIVCDMLKLGFHKNHINAHIVGYSDFLVVWPKILKMSKRLSSINQIYFWKTISYIKNRVRSLKYCRQNLRCRIFKKNLRFARFLRDFTQTRLIFAALTCEMLFTQVAKKNKNHQDKLLWRCKFWKQKII